MYWTEFGCVIAVWVAVTGCGDRLVMGTVTTNDPPSADSSTDTTSSNMSTSTGTNGSSTTVDDEHEHEHEELEEAEHEANEADDEPTEDGS